MSDHTTTYNLDGLTLVPFVKAVPPFRNPIPVDKRPKYGPPSPRWDWFDLNFGDLTIELNDGFIQMSSEFAVLNAAQAREAAAALNAMADLLD